MGKVLSHQDDFLRSSRGSLSERSLVLNATYEPISVVSSRRGIVLVLANKAVSVVAGAKSVHSASFSMKVPVVVRLRHFVHVPYSRRAPLSARAVMVRDSNTCQYCGDRAEGVDHVQPRSRSGMHIWENVVAACSPCNSGKGDRLLSETSFRLRSRPVAPPAMSVVALGGVQVPSAWHKYLPAMTAAV